MEMDLTLFLVLQTRPAAKLQVMNCSLANFSYGQTNGYILGYLEALHRYI